ncbi:MAG TPA: hypothetical protein VIX85_10390 [Acidimicrobiales bacterium]
MSISDPGALDTDCLVFALVPSAADVHAHPRAHPAKMSGEGPMCHDAVSMDNSDTTSPTIHRCGLCGGLVHPGDNSANAAWCRRCSRVVITRRDGGMSSV